MIPYFSGIAVAFLFSSTERSKYSRISRSNLYLMLYFFLLTVFIGFRFEVGTDWYNYLRILQYTEDTSFLYSLPRSEPIYITLNWISTNILNYRDDDGIFFVNVVCAIVSMYSLYKYCIYQNRPWLTAYIATCYFSIVIVMGLTRQGTAVCISCLALVALFRGQTLRYLILIFIASLFHVSAVIMLPLFILAKRRKKIIYFLSGTLFVVLVVAVAFITQRDTLESQYFESGLSSGGAAGRFVFHLFAAILFLVLSRKLRMNQVEKMVYTVFSWMSVLLLILLFLSPSSTVIDRIAFYISPLQFFVFSNLPNILWRGSGALPFILFSVMVLYLMKFTIWISFGNAAVDFLPYKNVLFINFFY